jgi:AraC-like DNA-binding protein
VSLEDNIIEYKHLEYKGKVVFEKLVMVNIKRVPKLFYGEEACFIYLKEGSYQLRTPEVLLHSNVGNGLLMKCGNYFFEQTKEDHKKSSKVQTTVAHLYPEIIKELFDFDLSISDFETDYDAKTVDTDPLMKSFMDSMVFLLDNPSVCNESMLKLKLKEFILLLSKTENAPSLLSFLSSLFKPYEYSFKQVIEQNLFSSLTLSELARLCNMSTSTFQRGFNKAFGQTPSKYILAQRMIKAKRLLEDRNMRISEVAFDCGYESTSTFNRQFKKHFNCSPSEFRLTEIGQ